MSTVSELTDTNETSHVLVEDLKASTIFLGLTRIAEAARTVQDALECLEIDYE